MKKAPLLFSVFLVIIILACLPLPAKERRGSTIEVTLIAGRQVRGELLAVKGHDLIILDQSKSQGFTVNIEHASEIRIKKRSRALSGLAMGCILGMGAGTVIYGMRSGGDGGERAGASIAALGIWGAATVIGGLTGAALSSAEVMRTDGTEPAQIAAYLRRLQSHARNPL